MQSQSHSQKPGIYPNVPYDEYERIDAARYSILKHFDRSAAHAREAMLHPKDPTAALDVGHAIHTAILQPDEFETTFARAPSGDKRTKPVKDAWKVFEEALERRLALRGEEYDRVLAMRDAVWSAGGVIPELLKGPGANEVVVLWQDGETGEHCKARVDRVTRFEGFTTLVDLKSTVDASPAGFPRQIARYLYHVQAGFYLDGFDALDPRPRRFLFLAIEKEPPHCATLQELGTKDLEAGRALAQRFLGEYAQAKATDAWPGYPVDIQTVDLPAWAYKKAFPDDDWI